MTWPALLDSCVTMDLAKVSGYEVGHVEGMRREACSQWDNFNKVG